MHNIHDVIIISNYFFLPLQKLAFSCSNYISIQQTIMVVLDLSEEDGYNI